MTEHELLTIFANSLNLNVKQVHMNLKINEIEEWDSLGHLAFLNALDNKTKGKASLVKDLGAKKSLKEILKTLNKNKI